jgi:hypothetical protein
MDSILSQTSPVHILTPYLRSILILSFHVFQNVSSLQVFRLKFENIFISTIRAKFPANLVILNLITLIIFGKGLNLWDISRHGNKMIAVP